MLDSFTLKEHCSDFFSRIFTSWKPIIASSLLVLIALILNNAQIIHLSSELTLTNSFILISILLINLINLMNQLKQNKVNKERPEILIRLENNIANKIDDKILEHKKDINQINIKIDKILKLLTQ